MAFIDGETGENFMTVLGFPQFGNNIAPNLMRGTEYKHVYALRNKDTGNYLLTYWASSQKHKALFSSRKKAEEAVKCIDDVNIEIVEL